MSRRTRILAAAVIMLVALGVLGSGIRANAETAAVSTCVDCHSNLPHAGRQS
jgi:hypothetical protein